jgi:hypothetical protein
MQTIILDDHGHAWDARSSSLRRLLRCPFPDFDFLSYLIDNLGFVTITSPRPGAARIRLRFETAAPAGIAAAIYLLADMGLERIVVSHSDAGLIDRLFSSISQAVAYIDQHVAEPHWQAAANVQSRQLPIETLAGARGPLPDLLSLWANSDRVTDLSSLKHALCATAEGRFVALEQLSGRLTIVDIGSGYDSYSKTWQENALGMPVEEQPDYEYGRWVQSMYGAVLETQRPRLDDIDATIRRPHLNDKVRVCYQRLILPFRHGRHGATRLVGVSAVKQPVRLSG